jgi:hypothetical protein
LTAHANEAAARMLADFELPLAAIGIDTMSAAAGFEDEDKPKETQKVMNMLRKLARATGALVFVIDHYGKMVETGVRGSSAKSGATDTILACLGERSIDGKVTNRRMALAKWRNGPTGRVTNFALKVVEAAWGSYCIIDWQETTTQDTAVKPVEKKRWPAGLNTFKEALESALLAHGQKRQPRPDMPEVLTVDRDLVRAEFNLAYAADTLKVKGEAFRRNERLAVEKKVMGSRDIRPVDNATTVFWIAAHEA